MTTRALITYGIAPLVFLAVAATSQTDPSHPERAALDDIAAPIAVSPEAPRESVDASIPHTIRRIQVPRGADLQRALDQAQPGDRLELESGATYQGGFRLHPKRGDGWIVVTSAPARGLPAPGERVSPSHAPRMARLRASRGSVITVSPGAHHYRLIGLDIAPSDGTALHNLVQIGDDEDDAADLPHHIIFDRCYLHGDPTKGTRRGIALNSRSSAIINSYLADFKEAGADSQAIAGWNGPGPFIIANNYLEAAGENVMFGGADPSIPGLVPADIRVTGNHLAKPLRWMKGHRDFEGTAWTVKNLFELKNARRIVIDGNLLEYNWPDAQNGFAILFTVRNQSGGAPWSVVEDVVFSNNVVRHVGAGINILGRDNNHPSERTRRIAIRGNLFEDVGGRWGSGRLFQLLDGTQDVAIASNTAFQTGDAVFGGDDAAHTGFVFENNLALHNRIGIGGSGTGSGRPTLQRYFPGALVRRNLLIGGDAGVYPADNFFPGTLAEAGIVKGPDGSYRRTPARRYAGAGSDGRDIGADIDALTGATGPVSAARAPDTTATFWRGLGAAGAGVLSSWSFSGSPAEVLFVASLLLLAYVYAGYPLIAWLRSHLLPKHHVCAPAEPTVSIIVVAHNEEDRIEARIDNLLALDYPADRREIVVGSDGSTDRTAFLANRYADHGVRVEDFRAWRGKAAVLNELVRRSTSEVVLFADARQRFNPDVLRVLVSHFADPTVGAVSGELMLTVDDSNGTPMGRGTAFYWRYEKFIRLHESRAGSTVGATGAIYAIRRALFEPIPDDTVLDDVLIPMRIVRQGYSVQFEPKARAFEPVSATARQEGSRKQRTIAGTFQLFAREPWLLNPWQNALWFETVSHKALRLTLPALHVTAFAANLALADGLLSVSALMVQMSFYGAGFAGHALRGARRRPIVFSVPYAMCCLIWTTVAGFGRFLTHSQRVTWERSTPATIR